MLNNNKKQKEKENDDGAQIATRVPVEIREKIHALAKENDETVSQILRKCIREYIKKHSKE